MNLIQNIAELTGLKFNSLSMGNFDGVHIGHQANIEHLLNSPPALLITFEPHPKEILEPNYGSKLLTPTEEKIELMRELGVDNLFILKFDHTLVRMPAKKFIKWLFVDIIKPKAVIVGYNHRFGFGAKGDFELLVHMGAKFGFEVIRVPPVFVDGFPVSSSWIRKCLLDANVELPSKLLDRFYSISSKVIPGSSRGAFELSYPTANLAIPPHKLIPKDGVYAVQVLCKTRKLKGMMCIGEKLTFGEPFSLEVHIFDFNKDLLNQTLQVELIKYLRPTRKFKDASTLAAQLKLDESTARKLLTSATLKNS